MILFWYENRFIFKCILNGSDVYFYKKFWKTFNIPWSLNEGSIYNVSRNWISHLSLLYISQNRIIGILQYGSVKRKKRNWWNCVFFLSLKKILLVFLFYFSFPLSRNKLLFLCVSLDSFWILRKNCVVKIFPNSWSERKILRPKFQSWHLKINTRLI